MREGRCVYTTADGRGGGGIVATFVSRRVLVGEAVAAAVAVPLRASTAVDLAGRLDRHLIELLGQFDQLEREIEALGASSSPTFIVDDDVRDAAESVLGRRQLALLELALSIRATTPAGWRARARTLRQWDGALEPAAAADKGRGWNQRMVAALIRDVVGETP
jgi:hypothetical protein